MKPRHGPDADRRPTLKAIILDLSSVNHVDITSVQRLIDVRNQLDLYAAPDVVDWHIACINNRWTKRALVSGGFGVPSKVGDGTRQRWKSIFSVAEIGGKDSAAAAAEDKANEAVLRVTAQWTDDEEAAKRSCDLADESLCIHAEDKKLARANSKQRRKGALVHCLEKPMFHIDLTAALRSAIANVEARREPCASVEAQRRWESC